MLIQKFLFNFFDSITYYLLSLLDWYGIVFLFSLIYILLHIFVKKIQNIEKRKTKLINKDIQHYKTKSEKKENKINILNIEKKLKEYIVKEPTDKQKEENLKMVEIVKKRKGNPSILLLLTILQIMIFVSMIFYFLSVREIEFSITYYLVALISFAIILLKGKFLILKALIVIFFIFLYWNFTGATMLFLAIVLFFRMVESVVERKNENKL